MIDPTVGIAMSKLALLSQMAAEQLQNIPYSPDFGFASSLGRRLHFGTKYRYRDALAIEIARQMSDDNGLTFVSALSITTLAGGSFFFENGDKALTDIWIGVIETRNSHPQNQPEWTITGFGEGEIWSREYFHGPMDLALSAIRTSIEKNAAEYLESDPARIFMTNVSAADRRLRKRAAELGIAIKGREFVGD